jgi:outer membrane protein
MTQPRRSPLFRIAVLTPLALAALSLSGLARAQSLQTLYEAARSYDATYLGAVNAADAARARADQSKALILPSVGLSLAVTRNNADTPYSSNSSTDTTQSGATLSASQSLFNRANSVTMDQAERSVAVAQAQLAAAEQDLIVRLSQAYFDVLAASDTLGTVQASKKAIAEQLASAKRNFEVGTATITDTREAQARFDLSLAQELAAENDLRVKQLALEQLVGQSNLKPRSLVTPLVFPPLQPASVDAWIGNADQFNTSLQQARIGLDVAKLETDKARAGHLPTATLTGAYARNHTSVDGTTSGTRYNVSGNGSNASVSVSLSVPLFAGFAVQNRVKETLLLEDKARNDLEAARRAVAQGTRSAFFGVQSGQAQVMALEAAESSSKLALEATQLGYKVGVRVNLDVLNAQTQLYQTQRDLAKARYDVIVGGLKLRQATGQLKPADVQDVNRLLAP